MRRGKSNKSSFFAGNNPPCAALPVEPDGLPTNYSTIGRPFTPEVEQCPMSGEQIVYQTIFTMDKGISVDEVRVEDYQLGGRPPSYSSDPNFCGISLATEKSSLFDIKDSQSQSQSPPPHPNSLWYDDGSVVLKAGDDFFRVHRSILSQKSSVFATVLLKSQAENTETYEECPMVTLDDDAEELRQLLLTIYELSYFDDNAQYFLYLCAILRLSTKYQVERLRDLALQRLKRGVPSTLAAFDDPGYQDDRENARRNVLAVINLARETSCLELLPCAYYYCSRLPTSTILEGDGDVVIASPDITACLLGKDQLLNMQRQNTHSFLFTHPKVNFFGASCQDCGGNTKLLLQYFRRQDFMTPCTFEQFTDWENIGVCKSCATSHQNDHKRGRQDAWAELPRIFGLESWEKIMS